MRHVREEIAAMFAELADPKLRVIDTASVYPLRYLSKLKPDTKTDVREELRAAKRWRIIMQGGPNEQDLREVHAQLCDEFRRR